MDTNTIDSKTYEAKPAQARGSHMPRPSGGLIYAGIALIAATTLGGCGKGVDERYSGKDAVEIANGHALVLRGSDGDFKLTDCEYPATGEDQGTVYGLHNKFFGGFEIVSITPVAGNGRTGSAARVWKRGKTITEGTPGHDELDKRHDKVKNLLKRLYDAKNGIMTEPFENEDQ